MNEPTNKEELQALLVQGKISRRHFLRSALIMGMSFGAAQTLLAACAPTTAPAGETAPAAETAPETPSEPVAGGELTWAINQDPVSLLPFGAVSTSNMWGKEFMYDSLLEWDKDLIVQPALAETWEAPDETTWIFHLRPDAVFHNGDPVTAEDVKYSIELQKTPPEPGVPNNFYPAIESVEIIDEKTVQFNMSKADPTVEGYLAWARYSAIIPKDAYDRWNLLTEGIGTGPFKLIQYVPNDRVEYEKNPDFWKPDLPYLDKLTLKVLPDESAAVAALRSGEIHGMSVTADTVLTLQNDPSITILSGLFAAPNVLQFTIKDDTKPWSDVRVRQAMSKVIDRQIIIDNVFGGQAELSGPIPPGYGDWFIPAEELAANWFAVDLEGAQQLMADAGFADGFAVTLHSIANHPATQIAEVVQEQLRAINIEVEIISEEIGTFAQRVGEGNFDWCSTARGMRNDPTRFVNDFGAPESGQGPVWFAGGEGWRNDELSELYQAALVNLDSATRHEQIRRIQEIVLEEAPHIYICQPYKFHAVRNEVMDMYVAFTDFHTGLRTAWLNA